MPGWDTLTDVLQMQPPLQAPRAQEQIESGFHEHLLEQLTERAHSVIVNKHQSLLRRNQYPKQLGYDDQMQFQGPSSEDMVQRKS